MHRTALKAASACFVGFVVLATAGGQAQQQAPKPGPEAQRLASLVGTWHDETELHQTPFSPAGKETGTSTCEWFSGNFQVVCRSESAGAMGKTAGMLTVGWHPARKAYLAQVIDSTGMVSQLTGNVTGNTWTFTSEGPTSDPKFGKVGKARLTIVDVSPSVQTSKFEVSLDGGPWTLVAEGKSTKVK